MSLKPPSLTTTSKWKRRLSYGLYAVALAFIAVAPLAYLLYTGDEESEPEAPLVTIQYTQPQPKPMAPGVVYGVSSVRVVEGHIFLVLLEDQNWHKVQLTAVSREEATADVVEVLKQTHSPTITLRRQVEGYWVVDFDVVLNGRRISLVEWLAERKLLL
jgi:hypothetical protein